MKQSPLYISHPLNSSLSKSAYSFAKHPRFAQPSSDFVQPLPVNYRSYLRDEQNRYVMGHVCKAKDMQIGKKREEHQKKYEIYTVRREVDEYIRQLQREGRLSKSKEKVFKQKNKYLLQEKQHNKQPESLCSTPRLRTEQSQIRHSKIVDFPETPAPTAANLTRKPGFPGNNMTISGYYPVGMELSSKGRYVPSTMRNVNSLAFSSPGKDRFDYYKTQSSVGPAYYSHFSQFGPVKAGK